METDDSLYMILKFCAALVFVLALMGGLALTLKRLGLTQGGSAAPGKRRLKVVETLPLDARRRAMILRRDGTEHLVILGPNGETVVETRITPTAHDDSDGKA